MSSRRTAAPHVVVLFLSLLGFMAVVHGSSITQQQQQQPTLDGYAFQCEHGGSIGFEGSRNVYCMNAENGIPCGHYQYDGEFLTGFSTLTGSFQATNLETEHGVLVSFTTNVNNYKCHAVSLDWTRYSHENFLGLSCPTITTRHENNMMETKHHFSFGLTGDVALRSTTITTTVESATEAKEGDSSASNKENDAPATVMKDLYGVFQYHGDENQMVRMHFAPQQDLDYTLELEGTINDRGEFMLTRGSNLGASGPCVHDGQSRIVESDVFVKNLSKSARASIDDKIAVAKAEERATWDSTVIAVGHASATTVAALGASVTLSKSKPAYGLTVGWGLAAVADKVEKHLSKKRASLSKTLKKGAMIQRMLCWAGSVVCVAAAATTSVCTSCTNINMVMEKLMAIFLARNSIKNETK